MKRRVCMLLMLTSVLTGCGRKEVPAEQTMQPMAEIVSTAVTEATLSAEDLLLSSLPERMRQAYEVGLVELEQLADLDRIVTVGEASAMLQKAYVYRTGVESKTLNELMSREEYAGRNADRGWIVCVPGITDLELTLGEHYENYEQWLDFLNRNNTGHLWWGFDERLGMLEVGVTPDGDSFYITNFWCEKGEPDLDAFFSRMGEGSLYGPEKPESYFDVYIYAGKVFDSTTGMRYFELEDGYIHPEKALTVADTVEYALRFRNFPNPMAVPNYVTPEKVGRYNASIITPDLLDKETDLPAASCASLPAWHGVIMDDMVYTEYIGHLDNRVYEYEIRAIKEAGFNYIGFDLDFGWLQDSLLITKGKEAYKGFVKSDDAGKLDLNRLEQIDQVLAWCMKYDIHLNLRCVGVGGVGTPGHYSNQYRELYNIKKYAEPLAAQWQAIARRYADIPNEYLSFTLFTVPVMEYEKTQAKNALLIPSLEAIRAESPDRCIIADVFNSYQDAEEFAELGVALSYRLTEPETLFGFAPSGYFTYNQHTFAKELNARGQGALSSFDWPYQETTDAEAILSMAHPGGKSFRAVMEIAQEHGVGFMLSQFGVEYSPGYGDTIFFFRSSYANEPYRAMIRDITSSAEKLGCGWCFAHWFSPYGVAFCKPVMEDTVYERLDAYPYYIDQEMLALFREINGIG